MPKPNFVSRIIQQEYRHGGNEREFWTGGGSGGGGGDRRVAFKAGGGRYGQNNKYKNKDWSNAIREHLEEEDIDMNIGAGAGKNFKKGKKGKGHGPGQGRRGSPMPVGGYRRLFEGPTGWYKVSIPYGDKYEKSFMQKLLLDKAAPLPFWPIAWQTNGTTVIFYVEDHKLAEKLLSLDRQVQLPNGFRLIVKVHPGTPNVDMTPGIKEKIKVVMARRYNSANKALDLSKFHNDPDLQDCFCAISKPIVFLAIVDIIAENIPDLEAICLNDNRISALGFLKKFAKKVPNIKILHLANNKIRDIIQLDAFIGLPVIDLLLDGNPLCDRFKEQSVYIRYDFQDYCNVFPRAVYGSAFSVCSEVRKRFPKCLKLDGIDLPPPITFDIAEEAHLPDPQQTFLCSTEGELIVRQFLEQYFLIYDSENRQPLLQAYHEFAMYSFTMAHAYGKDKNVSWLNWYNTDNRNILRVQDLDRRCKLLKQGQLSVVSFLQDMPLTKHDIHSFTVDLTLFTPQMITLTVSGMFKELKSGHKSPPTRFFYRTLVIVPAGSGFCIANEQYHITNATPEQAKEAFKTPSLPTPAPGTAAPPSTPEASPIIHQGVLSPDNNAKEEMVKQIMIKTGMNLEWSIKCLEGNDWDFMRAFTTFQGLQTQGAIPAEAFVK